MSELVLACGVFDLLHVGHVRHLEQARKAGTFLIVGVTRDKYVNKPGRPIIQEDERREMLQALACVNRAELVNDSLEALRRFRPDVFCKGADYIEKGLLPEELHFCQKYGTQIVHTSANQPTTSAIIERIKCTS